MPTVPQRYGRTDGRLTIAIPRFALRALRGKNNTVYSNYNVYVTEFLNNDYVVITLIDNAQTQLSASELKTAECRLNSIQQASAADSTRLPLRFCSATSRSALHSARFPLRSRFDHMLC